MGTGNGWIIFSIAAILFAALVAYRLKAKNPWEGTMAVAGFVAVFALVLYLLSSPSAWVVKNTPQWMSNAWGPVIGQNGPDWKSVFDQVGTGDDGNATGSGEASSSDLAGGGAPASDPVQATGTSHIVVSGETLAAIARQYGVTVDAIAVANGIQDVNRISVGQSLVIPGGSASQAAVGDATVLPPERIIVDAPAANSNASTVPSATPTPDFSGQLMQIAEARRAGDLATGRILVQAILGIVPNHAQALAYQQEIVKAEQLRPLWTGLGEYRKGEFTYRYGQEVALSNGSMIKAEDYVSGLLSGYDFQITEVQDRFWAGYYGESVTVACITDGWMKGASFQLQRYLVQQMTGQDEVGYIFHVGE